ncbi:MAG: hypothetical protein AB8B52_03825 [Winogradskyella sp.]|uniref:hypothetical protein n=1 Tax=Winogradskyella sp. TaxID=1883156 RepID=UPI00385A2FC5
MKIFKEEQRFNQVWLIILIAVCALLSISVILISYFKATNTTSHLELFTTIGMILLVSGLIFLFKLNTQIDEKGIHYQFSPFHWSLKLIEWQDIDKAYVRKYNALNEYGGWGLKGGALWNSAKGKAINVSGDIGIQLELKNGKKLLIGTQQHDNAKSVLTHYQTKINAT